MITVLRLGHRKVRDARISTHCGLVARAFGADGIVYSGEKDDGLLKSVRSVAKNWGGIFKVNYTKKWQRVVSSFKGKKIHLTMFGERIQDKINEIKRAKNLLVVVGGEKVPGEMYKMVDYNIAVTSQPHSEIAALAIFLDKYFDEKELDKKFKNAKIVIKPSKNGKNVKEYI